MYFTQSTSVAYIVGVLLLRASRYPEREEKGRSVKENNFPHIYFLSRAEYSPENQVTRELLRHIS